ncbi:hypothetical protein [Hymenobacter sp. YC55]|uniref:hypothetical protein n=1 Tax=Hymenobacter sp. YC55 TaxID=3034019 RepID=UPI0023F7821C|nr:hypothetical protein [Hymenobacter sp. YC55]MDF7811482.1 hypothetical protein [Hymenobacter sp. YC55]
MHATLLFQLRQNLERLYAQPIPIDKAADQLALRMMLASTIRHLRALHAYTPVSLQDTLRLRRVTLLEQESQALAPPGKVALGTWNLLHTYLKETIEAALSDAAESYFHAERSELLRAEEHQLR